MREILFRGKQIDNGKWVTGDLQNNYDGRSFIGEIVFDSKDSDIDINGFGSVEVDLKTIGQYTGLSDRNGAKIFEGDIVKQGDEIGKIHYEGNYCTFAVILKRNSDLFQHIKYGCEVLGNIHDNPELLDRE